MGHEQILQVWTLRMHHRYGQLEYSWSVKDVSRVAGIVEILNAKRPRIFAKQLHLRYFTPGLLEFSSVPVQPYDCTIWEQNIRLESFLKIWILNNEQVLSIEKIPILLQFSHIGILHTQTHKYIYCMIANRLITWDIISHQSYEVIEVSATHFHLCT